MYALARDGVLIQRQLDAAAAADRERFSALLATAPEAARQLLLPLCPSRLAVTEHRITCSMRIATNRSVAFSLSAQPINLGISALYETTTAESSSLSVDVRTVFARPPGIT